MLYIGSHVGFSKNDQLVGSLEEALSYNANTFMFYTGAPQNTMRYEIDDELTKKAYEIMKEKNILLEKVIVHAPYIINLANPDPEKHNFAISFLKQEVSRCEKLGIKNMVLRPGSHVGIGIDEGIKQIVDGLNKVLEDDKSVCILLETMAGKGSEVGFDFTQISDIIKQINKKDLIGVCMDTCHIHDSGYDLNDFDKVLDEFDKIVGLKYVKCIHINDSKNPCGAKKDRHENIGKGYIGLDNLIKVIYNKRLDNIPKILETPYINEVAPYKEEIELIRKYEK
jgi:deoxyribonuclease-4